MRQYQTTRAVPYSAEQMFDLAADVERYPQFLRGWQAVRILDRNADTLAVQQIVGLGPLRWRFASRALLQRPERLRISSTERPFEQLEIEWAFAEQTDTMQPGSGCTVAFGAICALRSATVEALASDFLDASFGDIVSAFEQRARQLYSVRMT